MKKIVIIHHTGSLGGGTKSLVDLCSMIKDKYAVTVFLPSNNNVIKSKIDSLGIKIHYHDMMTPYLCAYSGCSSFFSKENFNSICSLLEIRKYTDEIEKETPDLVIFNSLVMSVSALKLNKSIKRICMDRETIINPLHRYIYKKILNQCFNAVAFLCSYEMRKFDLDGKVHKKVIADCVPEEDLTSTDRFKDNKNIKYTILFMGGSSLIKGSDVLLRALAFIKDQNFQCIIAGDFHKSIFSINNMLKHIYNPILVYRLCKMRRAYMVTKKKVTYVGACMDIYNQIVRSDVIVFPSFNVHQPRPCIEAGYFEKPVILSDFPETKEYFRNGYNALTFKPKSAKDLSKKLVYAMNNKDKMMQLGLKNKVMSYKYHSYKRVKKRFINLIDNILE